LEADNLRKLLENIKSGDVPIDDAMKTLSTLPFEDLGYAKVDHHRAIRTGTPEVIFCQGKTLEQIKGIVGRMMAHDDSNILGTRATPEVYAAVREVAGDSAIWYEAARCVLVKRREIEPTSTRYIAIVSGGTSDMPVAEEAAVTAESLGNHVQRIYDVGVAGIHRLFAQMDGLRGANVLVAVAGMEGALASVVAGLVDKPVIAVPTSVGYGANFGGLAALLTMLNSCASGVSVVNIDNGFGAGFLASMMNKLGDQ
jgi:pyridinium-3,5-biscarboxylic acid mononucleotide synthase